MFFMSLNGVKSSKSGFLANKSVKQQKKQAVKL